MNTRPLIIAHRGVANGAPENSLEAFEAAIGVGSDMLEFDVRQTRDGRLITFHDPTANGVRISELTREQLGEHAGHLPPLLDEVLDLTRGRIKLDIELKEAGYVDRVLDAVSAHFDPDDLLVTSFLDDVVSEVKLLNPELKTGLLLGRDKPKPYLQTRVSELFPNGRASACRADYIGPHFKLARLGATRRGAKAGFRSLVWTVNDDAGISRFLGDPRVAAVITDAPQRALKLRAEMLVTN